MSQLVIYLPPPQAAPESGFAYVLSHNGQDVARSGRASAALLPFGGVQDVVALLGVQALSWHLVQLPKGSAAQAQKLRSVLEGLLEDRLLDDVAQLHMALQPAAGAAAAGQWVGVCDAQWLQQQLAQLEQAGCAVGRIVPEFAPAPAREMPAADAAAPSVDDARLYAIGGDGASALWVRTGSDLARGEQAPGVLVWPLPAPDAPLQADAAEEALCAQGLAHIAADPAVAKAAERHLRRSVAVAPQAQRWLRAAQSPWNLAQFAFANTGADRLRKRAGQLWHGFMHASAWQAVRWALVALVVVQLLGVNVWAWRTRGALADKQRAIVSVFTQTFPQAQPVVDAPVQMQRQLALLQSHSGSLGSSDMEAMLALSAQHLPDAQLQGLQWDGVQLRLKGLVLAAQQQAHWQSALAARGLQAQQDGSDWLLGPAT